MTSKENQKVKAFQTLLNFLEENPNKTAQVEPIVVDMKDLKKALSSTLTAETQSKTQSSIVSDETSRMRKQLESATAEIAALTLSYAARVKNAVLKAKMNVSKAELGKERIPMLPNCCISVSTVPNFSSVTAYFI